jgi:GTP-binding protein HflX
VSAVTGEGLEALLAAVQGRLTATHEVMDVEIPSSDGALINWLHRNSEVLSRSDDASGRLAYKVRVSTAQKDRLLQRLAKTA